MAPEGMMIGNVAFLRILLKDGRWEDHKVPHEHVPVTINTIWTMGTPTMVKEDKKKQIPEGIDLAVYTPPHDVAGIVVCKDTKTYEWYCGLSKNRRKEIEHGVFAQKVLKT